jgi:hypothetical protein
MGTVLGYVQFGGAAFYSPILRLANFIVVLAKHELFVSDRGD